MEMGLPEYIFEIVATAALVIGFTEWRYRVVHRCLERLEKRLDKHLDKD